MNLIKHMEAAFVLSLAVAGLSAVAVDSIPSAQAQTPARVAAIQPGIPVVHVTAKRLTTVEKLQSLALAHLGKRA